MIDVMNPGDLFIFLIFTGVGISSVPSLGISSLPSEAPESAEAEKAPESANIFSSFMHNLKAKIEGIIDSLKMLMISMMLRQRSDEATPENSLATREESMMRSSFTLTMIIFLVVVLKRMNK